jgi:hypothetical protein
VLDPFTQIHAAIWQALIAYPPWAQLVRQGLRVTAIPGTLPDGSTVQGISSVATLAKADPLSPGDQPEVRIFQHAFGDRPELSNSRALFFCQVFALRLSASPPPLDQVLFNQLAWLSRVALYKAGPNLGIPNLVYEFTWNVANIQDVFPDESERGWVCAVPLAVTFYVPSEVFNSL